MSPFEQIESIFHEALALPEGEDRQEWLARRCGSRNDLRADILALLNAHDAASAAPEIAQDDPPPAIPDELFGPYRPLRLLGRGGMSAVFLAERADGRFEQKVAVKVMASHLAGDDFLRRFRTEGQVLAALHHPNVMSLLDGGVSASGHPYLIVEYVEGEALNRYCDNRRLSIEGRLRLFVQVCQAVEYAHQSLVLHRDLKPANILVTPDRVVKLLDFGMAALLSETPDMTVTRARMLTPRYASPEQLRGERLGVTTDVFSLGVILYELLTGVWPFGDPESMLVELRRATGEASPIAMSSAVTSEGSDLRSISWDRLRRLLAGDLSAITLKALEGDPASRYASVAELAHDVARFLDGRPVQARPQTFLYRFEKSLRRRWLAAATAAVFLVGLSVSTALAIRQARVAGEEARIARQESQKSARVTTFLRGMLTSATRAGGIDVTVLQMLNAAEPGIAGSWKNDPLAEATLRSSLGASYVTLMQADRARVQLERSASLFESLGRHTDAADALLVLGINAQGPNGHSMDAISYYRRSLDELGRAGKDVPPALRFRVKVYLAGVLITGTYDNPAARALLDEALASGRGNGEISAGLRSAALTHRGEVYLADGQFEQADAIFRQSTAVDRNAFDAWVGLARSRFMRGDATGAVDLARRNYEIAEAYGVEDTAEAAMEWARYRSAAGEAVQALPQMRAAWPALQKNYHDGVRLAYYYEAGAFILNRAALYEEALQWAHRALAALDEDHAPERHPLQAASWEAVGDALRGLKRTPESASALEKAAEIYGKLGTAYGTAAERVRSSFSGPVR